jgi:prepilin peptidase CpaA
MSLAETGRWAVAAIVTGLLLFASVSDIRWRRIPNWTVLAIGALFVPWAFLNTRSDPWALALAAGAIALTIGVVLYALGMVGAGDSKLFAAVALFVGLGRLLPLGLATALAGGAIALVSLATRPKRAMVMFAMRGKGEYGRGIPYGVAIAIAGALIVWSLTLHLTVPYEATF